MIAQATAIESTNSLHLRTISAYVLLTVAPSVLLKCTFCSTSRYRACASASGHSIDMTTATTNESGIETSPGFLKGNHAVVCFRMSIWIVGDKTINARLENVPT